MTALHKKLIVELSAFRSLNINQFINNSANQIYLYTSVVFHQIGKPMIMIINAKATEANTRWLAEIEIGRCY